MRLLLDSFWRAAAYSVHPRVIALSFLPLVLMVALSLALGYFFWEPALDLVRGLLESSDWITRLWSWLEGMGAGNLKIALAPLIVIFTVTPFIVVVALLLVATMMAPAMVSLVSERRFAQLEKKKGGSFFLSLAWSLGSTLLALIALVISIPLWFVPLLILVLPPLIWGWLTYRVMAFDVLALHASKAERREIFRRHRSSLLLIGVVCGYLGAAPSVVWVSGALFAAAFVVLVPLAIWLYTLVFAFSALWFAHFALSALRDLRAEAPLMPAPTDPAAPLVFDERFIQPPQALPDDTGPRPHSP